MAPRTTQQGRDDGHRIRIAALATAACCGCAGTAILAFTAAGGDLQRHPPEPAMATGAPTLPPPARPRWHAPQLRLPASTPTAITIPAIKVHSALLKLGLAGDGTLQVPRPPNQDRAAWYTGSVTPGQPGTAVIEGHLDSDASGPSVFYRLGALTPGQQIQVDRADHTTATFTIDAIGRYPKTRFPTAAVYANTPGPSLRLITCGGTFDHSTGHYRDNTVVFARLTASGRH
ncbi:class F sortase [Actinomadura meridiana]|uniref:Class F sortase n=1 Tax=Actinomadura meridiana TaxID=559626 RepID=A0ABP8BWS3_9ACTN